MSDDTGRLLAADDMELEELRKGDDEAALLAAEDLEGDAEASHRKRSPRLLGCCLSPWTATRFGAALIASRLLCTNRYEIRAGNSLSQANMGQSRLSMSM